MKIEDDVNDKFRKGDPNFVFREGERYEPKEKRSETFQNGRGEAKTLLVPAGGWREHAVTADQLSCMTFPEINMIVPDVIPEGLSILAGRPKIGKSWLAYDVCLAVADEAGATVLGREPIHGDVLYCALEDTNRRLQHRASKLLWPHKTSWPKRLTLVTKWRKLDDGGVDDIADWASSVKEPRLVVLDTLAGVRPDRNRNDTTYDGDYKALLQIHRLANDGGYGSLALTHTRKADATEDQLDAISGTLGQVGCADTGLVLARNSQGSTLYVRGRDVEENEFAVSFSKDTCRWTILGGAAEVHMSDTRKKILAKLLTAKEPLAPKDIIHGTGLSSGVVYNRLADMVERGEVVKTARGAYHHPSKLP